MEIISIGIPSVLSTFFDSSFIPFTYTDISKLAKIYDCMWSNGLESLQKQFVSLKTVPEI
jgi:hypothetical protein